MTRTDHPEPDDLDLVAPACRPTTERLQRVLDGDGTLVELDTDPHPAVCLTCRERIRAARGMLAALATAPEAPVAPAGLSGSILAAVRADRRARLRQRVFAAAGGLAVAAAVVLVIWLRWPVPQSDAPQQKEIVVVPEPAPQPGPPPVRLGDQLAAAGEALRDSSRPITEPAASAPGVFASLVDTLSRPPAQPAAASLEPARKSLADIPEAARIGFEPVTGSAQKGLNRLLRDVSAIQPGGSVKQNP
jgi:hypothetical protein